MTAPPPIAIVGRGCILPGAASPAELWELVHSGRSAVSNAEREDWNTEPSRFLTDPDKPTPDKAWTLRGGFVRGFDRAFDPNGFALDPNEILATDKQIRWLLHAGRQALVEAGYAPTRTPKRSGLVIGNLSYPTDGHTAYAQSVWLNRQEGSTNQVVPRSRDRFSSGLPASIAARALGCNPEAMALDAACASALYAMKLACDQLHDGSVDLMLAGAVNAADGLFLQLGFTALGALSRTGQSRPFHRSADGLLPAQGAVILALRRLEDALADRQPILGLIRGVGLSNDGSGGGFLAPDPVGQYRALRDAYDRSGIDPATISLIECHATGTVLGDRAELTSMGRVFEGQKNLPIGSLKSNLGHLLAAAGGAAILKVLGAMQAGVRPPTLGIDEPVDLWGTPFRLLDQAEDWTADGPRRAGINAFGFGGCNAHLILEEWVETHPTRIPPAVKPPQIDLAVISLGVRAAGGLRTEDFVRHLLVEGPIPTELAGGGMGFPAGVLHVTPSQLKVPPQELPDTLGQQTLLKLACLEALANLQLPRERTGVYVGMGCDPESARHGGRWRTALDPGQAESWAHSLTAARVKGTMPNIPANQLNRFFHLDGPGFTISAEEASGLKALELARRAIAAGEIDAAIVAAVDLSCETVHRTASGDQLSADRQLPGDAAVVLVVRRLADAQAAGQDILAILPADHTSGSAELDLHLDSEDAGLSSRFGHAHAASGLMLTAAGIVACSYAALPRKTGLAVPWLASPERRTVDVHVSALGGSRHHLRITAPIDRPARRVPLAKVSFRCYAGSDRADLIQRVEADQPGGDGPVRLAIVADDLAASSVIREKALSELKAGREPHIPGARFGSAPISGEIAYVFAPAAVGYPGMAQDLLLAMPNLWESLRRKGDLDRVTSAIYPRSTVTELAVNDRVIGSWAMSQFHVDWSLNVMGLRPQATLSVSSGEVSALEGLGAWDDPDQRLADWENSGLPDHQLGGECHSVRTYWEGKGWLKPNEPIHYTSWHLMHNVEKVRAAVAGKPRVWITLIFSPNECTINGEYDDCKAVIAQLKARSQRMSFAVVAHCPEVTPVADLWHRVHHRPTREVDDVRFYSNGINTWFKASADAAADAYTKQACNTVDFPKTVEAAYRDGVRIFVEHGPRNMLSRSIERILGDREHLTVSFDLAGRPPIRQLFEGTARLWVAGAPINLDRVLAIVEEISPSPYLSQGPTIELPTRLPEVVIPAPSAPLAADTMMPEPKLNAYIELDLDMEEMPVPPILPPVDDLWVQSVGPVPAAHTNGSTARPVPRQDRPFVPAPVASAPLGTANSLTSEVTATHRSWLAAMADAQSSFLATTRNLANIGTSRPVPTSVRTPFPVQRSQPIAPPLPPVPPPVRNELSRPTPMPVVKPTPPTPVVMAVEPGKPLPSQGLTLSRAQLEHMAGGKISDVFGPLFTQQDQYEIQVRMPMPPLLLADRVVGLVAEAGSMGTGSISTETDVRADSWYLHHGRMPPGIMIESGQADLLLISYLGVDFLVRGTRRYRLLSCDLTYHGPLAKPGETLHYDIHLDGHARTGEIRLFFFHYDCYVDGKLRMSVRNGQAGFFTQAELDDSEGVLWDAETGKHDTSARLDPPLVALNKSSLSKEDLQAFASGNAYTCFGPGFERAAPHSRTPGIPSGEMMLIDRVTKLDHSGGPWGRGYLHAELDITPNSWFFPGHFKNDPCMPGTLMFDGCMQALAIYMTSLGLTIDRDGWRFEPLVSHELKMRCRGQVIPRSRVLTYEVFVESVVDGDEPALKADVLCSVDGLKAFHCRAMGIRLTPAWPLNDDPTMFGVEQEPGRAATAGDVRGDHAAMMACALGRPSDAFGVMYSRFDSPIGVPRLPAPPYHFVSRVTKMPSEPGQIKAGVSVEAELDVTPSEWYFGDTNNQAMPISVLTEAALQPCGWLASFVGCAAHSPQEMRFRNLDGSGKIHGSVIPNGGKLITRSTLTSLSRSGATTLTAFQVECTQGDRPIFSLKTMFGFFPPASLVEQVGAPFDAAAKAVFDAPKGSVIDLRSRPPEYFNGSCGLDRGRLLMLDRVTHTDPQGGRAGLGTLRAEKDVQPGEWFFKAHFFQDPVQPGSLGIEAMAQLLQFHMLSTGMHKDRFEPRFEPIGVGEIDWKFRGQVVPTNKAITVTAEITEVGTEDDHAFVRAEASFWCDGLRIYTAGKIGMRIIGKHQHARTTVAVK